jgi:hypothetical protein
LLEADVGERVLAGWAYQGKSAISKTCIRGIRGAIVDWRCGDDEVEIMPSTN